MEQEQSLAQAITWCVNLTAMNLTFCTEVEATTHSLTILFVVINGFSEM